jgi:hypothetical protein
MRRRKKTGATRAALDAIFDDSTLRPRQPAYDERRIDLHGTTDGHLRMPLQTDRGVMRIATFS